MPPFAISWKAYGIAEVFADTQEEAERIVSERCFGFDDSDFEYNTVDGVDVNLA